MFEFSTALKYLIPRRKQLSVSLIALMAILVISLVVWLVLVFLSVTEGIERGWMDKLTKLNAPLRINPTPYYYDSYYYHIDAYSSTSDFRTKTIGEKAVAKSDPYQDEIDEGIPSHFPLPEYESDGTLLDPVKRAYQILKESKTPLVFQDYEIGAALLRLQMLRTAFQGGRSQETQSFITQASYVASFADKSPYVASLVLPPRVQDLNHLFFLASRTIENTREDSPSFVAQAPGETSSFKLKALAEAMHITHLKNAQRTWRIPFSILPANGSLRANGSCVNGRLTHLFLSPKGEGTLRIEEGVMTLLTANGEKLPVPETTPLIADEALLLKATVVPSSLLTAQSREEIQFKISGLLQKNPIEGVVSLNGLEIASAEVQREFEAAPSTPLPWLTLLKNKEQFRALLPINAERETGVLLARNFQENGALIGDRGYLSYTTASLGSIQEQRLPIFIAGFYDPGVMSIGNKVILVPGKIAQTINASSSSFNLDKLQSNGINIWFDDLRSAKQIQQEIETAFIQAGIDRYWKVTTFHEYDFAKDLLQQFQSDKYLFTLVGGIILIVACCNIISLLVLLVNDKKREIGVLQAMGASSRSIALIFGLCGSVMGIVSSLIGIGAALYTMSHIDGLVHLLSAIQGHDAFNAAFYGKSLPNELSKNAVIFVLIATPIISLCAGLVPAIKACRLRPSAILRSE